MSTQEEKIPEQLQWYDALRKMLEPYEPAPSAKEAEKYFSTAEIASALEMHYMVPADAQEPAINGLELVDTLHELGYSTANIGEMGLHWLMKKKK